MQTQRNQDSKEKRACYRKREKKTDATGKQKTGEGRWWWWLLSQQKIKNQQKRRNAAERWE